MKCKGKTFEKRALRKEKGEKQNAAQTKKARLRALENHLWLRCPTEPKERGVQ